MSDKTALFAAPDPPNWDTVGLAYPDIDAVVFPLSVELTTLTDELLTGVKMARLVVPSTGITEIVLAASEAVTTVTDGSEIIGVEGSVM
jgi:hypothetical protein